MKKILIPIILLSLLAPGFSLADESLSAPLQISMIAGRESTTINWTKPVHDDFIKVKVFTSVVPIENYFSYLAVEKFCDLLYEGTEESAIATGLAPNLPYYFIVFAEYSDGRHSKSVILQREADLENEGQVVKATNVTEESNGQNTVATKLNSNGTLAGASATVVNEVSFGEAEIVYNYNQKLESPSDPDSGRLSLFIIVKSPNDLSEQDKNAISYFIDRGTPTTILLGAGERTGVLNSYLSVFEKLPSDVLDWQDVIKIANGRWPNQRNTEAEEKASSETFSAIYKRPANMNNSFDSAAVTVIAYGLRPANRNLESEKNAIKIYESIFSKSPVEAFEWDMVRAIAYSGATR